MLFMARKPRSFNLRKVRLSTTSAAGALPAADVITNAIVDAATDTYRAVSIIASYGMVDDTAGEGPVAFGLAHSDYTAAEVEECLESFASIDLGDKVSQERANRLVREIGTMGLPGTSGVMFNDGKPVKTKLNWLIAIGSQISLWIKNKSGTILTTGALVGVDGVLWIKDRGGR